jgi:hypothetical protein
MSIERPELRHLRIGLFRRLTWAARLAVHRSHRVQIHLPMFAQTRSGEWRDFEKTPWLHDETTLEIKRYLGQRAGMTFEILRRDHSEGEWGDGAREKNIVLYIDVDLRIADIDWFVGMEEAIWRERFDQHEIYLIFQKIWKEKSRVR